MRKDFNKLMFSNENIGDESKNSIKKDNSFNEQNSFNKKDKNNNNQP